MQAGTASRSYLLLLADLCKTYHLPGVQYELVGDSGPPHMRRFTMRARLGQHERVATASSKKTARQIAAQQLYTYMHGKFARLIKEFNEVLRASPSEDGGMSTSKAAEGGEGAAGTLVCSFCAISFMDSTLYYLHKGCHSDSDPWKCKICGEQCCNVYEFNSHLLRKSHQ